MINRSLHMIFESSGMPVPTEEEVQFEAREIVQRSGWGLPLIEALRKLRDPHHADHGERDGSPHTFCRGKSRCLGTC